MKVVRQPKAGTAHEKAPPDMRWVMFWLFAALTFLAGGLATAGWSARREGVAFLVWVERLPDRLIQSAQLVGLWLMLAALALGWGGRRWLALAIAVGLGAYLGVLATARKTEGGPVARSRTLSERFQAAPDWPVRLVGFGGAAVLLTASFLGWERQEIFTPAAIVGWAWIGLMCLAGPRPFRFRRR